MSDRQQPLGIRTLASLEMVGIRQKTKVFSGNEYVVLDPQGQALLVAREEAGLSLLAGKHRAFDINVFDNQDQNVIQLRRPYTCGPDKMQVTMDQQLVSVVRQEMTLLKPVLNINDARDRLVLRVKGPAVTSGQCDFEIFTPDKKCVGVIRKLWGGLHRELLTDSDSFQIRFPPALDVGFKAAVIGSCFLIDFLYYDS